jgi:putative ABC transport system permease protein
MIPTATGDPLLGQVAAPAALDRVVLSQTAAEKLRAKPGDVLEATFTRQVSGQRQAQRTPLHITAVLRLEAFARDGIFTSMALLEAVEDYRDGRAVEAFG